MRDGKLIIRDYVNKKNFFFAKFHFFIFYKHFDFFYIYKI